MKVTILQTDIKWVQPGKNQVAASQLISNNPGSDLYILPEMWATGFITDPTKYSADVNFHESLEWMKETAQSNSCAICGSLSILTPQSQYRNRLYFVMPGGEYYYYDKHHLFKYGGENEYYTAGNKRVIAKYKKFRFLLQTCYDLRFPVWMRYKEDYDAIVFVANWPQNRQDAWNILLKARAIENQCYVIGANRTGEDDRCQYNGNSAIIAPQGSLLAKADDKEQAVTAEIDLNKLNHYRSKFPVLTDRDIF